MVVHSYKTGKPIDRPRLQPRSYIRLLRQAASEAARMLDNTQAAIAKRGLARMLRKAKANK